MLAGSIIAAMQPGAIAMSVTPLNAKTGPSRRRRLFAALTLIILIVAYGGWQFAHRYQIESEVLDGYKTDNRELLVVLIKELENEPQHWGRADLISKTLADRLRQRGYSVQLVESETVEGLSLREKVEAAADSTPGAYEAGATALTSQALSRAAQAHAGVLRVYLSEVRFKRLSKTVISETYVLELSNPDRSPAWKATLTYHDSLFEPLFYLFRYSFGDPAAGREEALADKAIERMQQQGVLK
jgi:hypothetical protein